MKLSHFLTAAAFGLTLGLAAGAAQAQQAPTPTDVKGIGDWTVRCFPTAGQTPCEMYEEMDDKNTRQRVLGVSIAYVPSADRHIIQIAVPLGISIPKGVIIRTDTFTTKALPYRRCDRAGCYVEMVMDNGSIDQMSKVGPNANIVIVADDGKPFDLHFSLNGFGSAHDAMANLAREKAKGAKPADAAPAAPAPAP